MLRHFGVLFNNLLVEDLPEHCLKRGDVATVVEHYSMPDEQEDGYSLEGFDVLNVTVEVSASQIVSASHAATKLEKS